MGVGLDNERGFFAYDLDKLVEESPEAVGHKKSCE
jgi:hypothetical protein